MRQDPGGPEVHHEELINFSVSGLAPEETFIFRPGLVHDCSKRRAAVDALTAYADRNRYAQTISTWEGMHEIVEANAPRTPRAITTWIDHLLANDELTTAWANYYRIEV